ncbi:hypothetical protein BHE74_00041150 [Ensete ventricosum]|nr:hypothetical protein BHE74_00041150 [Ensete ventricosum]RZS05264.1 hypothetical protein BHM03_00035733 [Ensete ventricosum]
MTSSPEVQEVPAEAAARQPAEVPMKRSTDEPARTHKKHKLLAPQRHKSHYGEGSSRARSPEGERITQPIGE